MAFGFSPKHIEEISIETVSPEHFLALAIEAAKALDWKIGFSSFTGFIAYTGFSMSSWSEEVKVTIDGSSATIKSECTGSQLMDWGKNKENTDILVELINQMSTTLSPDEIEQKYEALKPTLIAGTEATLNQAPLASKEKMNGFLSIFKPVPGYFITPILLNLNILIFILMVLSGVGFFLPDNQDMLNWGANFKPMTLDGQWWRLITCCFLHIGVFHLLMNMYALLYIGLLLEPLLGSAKFLAAYLLTGLAASITSLMWHDLTISAGASGAIFGMYGVFLAMLTTNLIEKSARKTMLTSIVVFVGYNLLNGMKGGIDNAAHIGGLVSGLIIGYAYFPSLKNGASEKLGRVTTAILVVGIVGISAWLYNKTPNDIGEYDKKMPSFYVNEAKALEIFKLKTDLPKEKILFAIKENGIDLWKKNIELLTELDRLKLPAVIYERDKKLLRYCELRIKSYQLVYNKYAEGAEENYNDSAAVYNNQILKTLNSLKTN